MTRGTYACLLLDRQRRPFFGVSVVGMAVPGMGFSFYDLLSVVLKVFILYLL